jgi:hypothetical protein
MHLFFYCRSHQGGYQKMSIAPGIIVFTTTLAFVAGSTIGFVAGYFFAKGPDNEDSN